MLKKLAKRLLFLLTLLTYCFIELLSPAFSLASTWTQTDWSGGQGGSTINQYSSLSSLDPTTTSGQVSLSQGTEKFSNTDFESNLTGWSPNVNWWEAGGASGALGAWQAKGATSQAASYNDLTTNENDLSAGGSPNWNSTDGWVCNSDYYDTGISFADDYSVLAQFNSAAPSDSNGIFGSIDATMAEVVWVCPSYSSSNVHWYIGSNLSAGSEGKSPAITAGNLGIADTEGYRNGVAESLSQPGLTLAQPSLYLCALNWNDAGFNQWVGNIEAAVIYDNTLSADQMSAIATEMASSLTQVSRDTGTTYGSSSGAAKLNVQADKEFVQSVNVGDTSTYTIEAYVYTDGSEVTSSDVELYYNGATVSTTYTSMGSGWYKLNGDVTGAAAARDYGVQIKSTKTVYLDEMGLFQYNSPGTLTSNIYDTGQKSDWGLVSWTSSGGGTIQVKVRTSSKSDMNTASNWPNCNFVTNNTDLSDNNCVNDKDRYVQYQVTFTSGSTPLLEEININYSPSDLTPPTAFDLISPDDKAHLPEDNLRPSFKWRAKSYDLESGLDHWSFEVGKEATNSSDFKRIYQIDNIPKSRTFDQEYKYEADQYIAFYEGFGDDDINNHNTLNNNYITLYTKSSDQWENEENDGQLKLGRLVWKVKAIDKAGNQKEASRILFIDPQVEETSLLNSILGWFDQQEEGEPSLRQKLEKVKETIKQIPESLVRAGKKAIKPVTFILLGLLVLGIPLGIYLLFYFKKRQES